MQDSHVLVLDYVASNNEATDEVSGHCCQRSPRFLNIQYILERDCLDSVVDISFEQVSFNTGPSRVARRPHGGSVHRTETYAALDFPRTSAVVTCKLSTPAGTMREHDR